MEVERRVVDGVWELLVVRSGQVCVEEDRLEADFVAEDIVDDLVVKILSQASVWVIADKVVRAGGGVYWVEVD